MQVLSWREVDFAGVVLAGLVVGYVMALAGLRAGAVPGLAAVDIADFGRRYMASDRPSAWLLDLGSHLANSVLLAFAWASVLEQDVRPLLVWLIDHLRVVTMWTTMESMRMVRPVPTVRPSTVARDPEGTIERAGYQLDEREWAIVRDTDWSQPEEELRTRMADVAGRASPPL